jgi:Putative outer membrane beta-barrel porin, MtrB/PioB
MGLLHDNAWDIGIEAAWKPTRGVTVLASYTHEEAQREINAANSTTTGLDVQTRDNTDTFIFGVNAIVIPEKLDVKGTFTAVRSFGSLAAGQGPGTTTAVNSNLFPDVHTNFDRVDIIARYMLDPIRQAGIKFEPFLKARYLWERNSTDDWQPLAWNYMYNFAGQTGPTFAKGIMLGWDNPNYNVQVLMLSAGMKW